MPWSKSLQNSWEKLKKSNCLVTVKRQKYFFRTKFAHFSRPAETDPYENWWIGLILPTWFCGIVNVRPLKWILSTLNNLFVMRVFPQIWNIIKICLTRWRQDQCQAVGPFSSAPQLSSVPVITTISSLLMLLFLHWSNCLFFRVVIGNDRFPPKTLNKTTIHCQSFTITNSTTCEIYLGNDEHYIAQPSTWSK